MGILALAGGAQEGLDSYLARMLAERKQAEEERSNRATEDYRSKALQENVATRRDASKLAAQGRADSLAEKQDDNARAAFGTIPAGNVLGDEGSSFFLKHGVPQANIGTRPGIQAKQFIGLSSLPGAAQQDSAVSTQDVTGPEQKVSLGTEQMREKAATESRMDNSATAAIDAKVKGLEQAAERLKQQGELNAANILLAQARAEAASAQADKTKAGANTVKVGEGGKRILRSLDQSEPLIDRLIEDIRKSAPDIEDPRAQPDSNGLRINQKYNTAGNLFSNLAKYAKYKIGMQDESSPTVQITKLLQPINAGQYLAGSRSRQMLELALAHLDDPNLTTAEQYSRLKTLKAMMPQLRKGVLSAELPVTIGADGQIVDPGDPAGGGDKEFTFDPKTGELK